MSIYRRHILPRLLDSKMKKVEMHGHRIKTVSQAQGEVLEIGFGSGLNLQHYPKVGITKLSALEPSPKLFDLAKSRMEFVDFPVENIIGSAENISLPDSSVDTVVSTWVLCSVKQPEEVLKEIHRVLKPGGKFLFVEHGISPKKHIKTLQHICNPLSRIIAGGCHLNRNIEHLLESSQLTRENLNMSHAKNKPLAYMYRGVYVKKLI